MKDKLSLELSLYKFNKKYLGHIDLTNVDISSSSLEAKFIIILDKSGSMDESVPKIVNKIIPKILSNLKDQTNITLITFSEESEMYSGNAEYFSKLDLTAYGSTYMSEALIQLEKVLNDLSYGSSIRILVFSDGELHDQEKTIELSSTIAEKFRGKFRINAQAIRYYTSTDAEPDTKGLSSILQLNSINETPKLEDINHTIDEDIITNKICAYFTNDGLGLDIKLKSNFFNLYINPWETPTNEITLIKGKNLFWIDNDNKFNINKENGNLFLEGKKEEKIELKIKLGEDINQDNYKIVLNDSINFFMKKLKILKILNNEESQKEMNQIVSFFESLENSVFNGSFINDEKISSRKRFIQNTLKKRKASIFNQMKSIQNDNKVSQLNAKQQAEYLRDIDINDKTGKNLAKRAFSEGINFDEVTKKEILKMKENFPKLQETLKNKNFDESSLSVSFFSTSNTLEGIEAVCDLVDDKEIFDEITTIDVIKLLNIVGIGCDAPIGNYPDPMTYRIKEIYPGCYVSLSDVLDVSEKKKGENALVDFNTKKTIINVIPVFENQDIHKFLIDNCPKLLEYTASIGMRRILADVNYTYDYTILAGIWDLIMRIMKEKSEINNKIFCKLVDSYIVASKDHFSYLYPILKNQIDTNDKYSIFMNNNGVTNMTAPLVHILKTYSEENKTKIIPKILRALFQYETYLVCRKMIRMYDKGDNKYINGYLYDLLGVDLDKYGTKLSPMFETPLLKNEIQYCENYYLNEEKLKDFYDKNYWINYIPFIAEYYQAYIDSEKNDIKEVFKKIPEKTEENMEKILEIENLKKFQMYCIVQGFLFKEKQDRTDTDKKVMKIKDLKYTEEAEKMVKKYIKEQYANDYALRVQQRNKEQIEILKNELVDKLINSESLEEYKNYFVNGITKGIFTHKISDPSSKGLIDLKNKLLSDEKFPLKIKKIAVFMSGRIKDEVVWNKGEAYRPCFEEFEEYFKKIGKIKLYKEIAKNCKCVHIYRELPNRQGHSNDKPSYWAAGFETLSEYFKTLDKKEIEKYKKIHYNCCGVSELNGIKIEKKEERKIRKKEFKKSQRSSRKSSM